MLAVCCRRSLARNRGFLDLFDFDQLHVTAGMGAHRLKHGDDVGMVLAGMMVPP